MTVSADVLQALMIDALTRQDAAGDYPTGIAGNWFSPRDWPTTPGEMPIGMVQSPKERKEGLGRSGAPQFTVTTTIRLVARVTAKAATGDAGAMAALSAIATLQRQIEIAVINDYELRRHIQQYTSVDVVNGVKDEAEYHVAELVMDFALEFYQGPEDFQPTAGTPIEQLTIYADLVNVFSPTGDYSGTDEGLLFPAEIMPSPRTAGPDGRAEGVVFIAVPTVLDFSDPNDSGLLPPI